jgi:hypothetical protein
MFISNKEKNNINENIDRNKCQIENVIKHVAKLQVDMSGSGFTHIAGIKDATEQLQKKYFGITDDVKSLQGQIGMLREINDLIIARITKYEGLLKDSPLLLELAEKKKKEEELKERKRAYGRKYYYKKKAERIQNSALRRLQKATA